MITLFFYVNTTIYIHNDESSNIIYIILLYSWSSYETRIIIEFNEEKNIFIYVFINSLFFLIWFKIFYPNSVCKDTIFINKTYMWKSDLMNVLFLAHSTRKIIILKVTKPFVQIANYVSHKIIKNVINYNVWILFL